MANLRLTFVIESLGGGGAQRVLSLLVAELCDLGQQVSVVTYADNGPDIVVMDPRAERLSGRLGGSSRHALGALLGNARRIAGLRSMVRRSRPDVVIAFVGTTNILTILACIGLAVPVVISERNDPARQSLGRVWDMLRRTLYRRAAFVTANSPGAVAAMQNYVPEAKLRHIPNPLSPRLDPWTPDTENPFVLAVGRLNRQKGFDVLLDAFAVFAPQHEGWRLMILGEGLERDSLARQAESLGLADRVRLEGFVDPAPYYKGCGMFVLPSRFEGMSNALLEAMGHGCPTIATAAQNVASNDAGADTRTRAVPPEDPQALADAMSALAENEGLARRLGSQARREVEALEPRRVALAWLAVCERLAR
jgi:glycosyltransferase involved in cell wall biosynthesis